jgi:hypothetical protein
MYQNTISVCPSECYAAHFPILKLISGHTYSLRVSECVNKHADLPHSNNFSERVKGIKCDKALAKAEIKGSHGDGRGVNF